MNDFYFKEIFSHPVGKNHYIEVYKIRDDIKVRKLGLDVDVRRRSDHGGVVLTMGVLGRAFVFEFYDTRHWDEKTQAYNNDKRITLK